ncbi:MAG: methylenetetrahydrofolate reductase [Proteobacteria bacterium]|nr:methylenetetrahydrofolate reductase [Cystobacterineae bacterium]MCL2258535.1 methylenetetrahydrofolate reductase [Cystobacterineae bacterium]MCL2315128.1 methylenetetrahydrofolate reductase [Pseudomonadota bacterium]
MQVSKLLLAKGPLFSFEFFPPKTPAAELDFGKAVEDVATLEPAFVSVTYGAAGSSRASSLSCLEYLRRKTRLEICAHLALANHSQTELLALVDSMAQLGIENILALRGDAVKTSHDGLRFAADLIHLLRKHHPHLCIGAACYPEIHPEAPNAEEDLLHLKHKVEAGADFLVSQLFFDNRRFFAFAQRAREAGIGVPIVPGVLPVTRLEQAQRIAKLCSAQPHPPLFLRLEALKDNPSEIEALGIAFATAQCAELLAYGTPGIHFYTLNRSSATRTIVKALRAVQHLPF